LVANARGCESPPVPSCEASAEEPERDGRAADDRREFDKVDEMGEEPVSVRETWVLEEANEPGLVPLVMCVCPPYYGEHVCVSRGRPPICRGGKRQQRDPCFSAPGESA